ncbi:hypothetical protein L227DRAFT_576924 [Lentinus tigrinus ALCF2SS1-6]|uniref:Uncharacterized protein n=1 Tax=Lentinus tigrinus ALCF2SS1-6 TaxID=1328759 RepID=A0A5C2S4F9_9APHY|nr:hypothetical protein L227DRAFT_576924 [Lentinus tigrinus ALCF2SS1-6]
MRTSKPNLASEGFPIASGRSCLGIGPEYCRRWRALVSPLRPSLPLSSSSRIYLLDASCNDLHDYRTA